MFEGIPENNNEALASLIDKGREIFFTTFEDPVVRAFWKPRFKRIAEWFVQHSRRATNRIALHVERRGIWHFILNGRPVQLRATADRIDQMAINGLLLIIGAIPSRREVEAGLAPQLPLEAVILARVGLKTYRKGVWSCNTIIDGRQHFRQGSFIYREHVNC